VLQVLSLAAVLGFLQGCHVYIMSETEGGTEHLKPVPTAHSTEKWSRYKKNSILNSEFATDCGGETIYFVVFLIVV
jgi:hypothetical protein